MVLGLIKRPSSWHGHDFGVEGLFAWEGRQGPIECLLPKKGYHAACIGYSHPWGGVALETFRKTQDMKLHLGAYIPQPEGWVWWVVVGGVCLLAALIGRLGHRGMVLVGMLNEVPAAVKFEFGPPAVPCESHDPPDLLEEDGLTRPVVDFRSARPRRPGGVH